MHGNKHDVNLIMKHYADSIEFCSPVVQKVLGDSKGLYPALTISAIILHVNYKVFYFTFSIT